jgi:hypothetical protein
MWRKEQDRAFGFRVRTPRVQRIEFADRTLREPVESERTNQQMECLRELKSIAESIRRCSSSVEIVVKANEWLEHDTVLEM